jgi:hypothetical protein
MNRHVVFVHGLRRANAKVWISSGKRPEVWPRWLAADIEKLGIWSMEHDSAPTWWHGPAMALVDRANNVLPRLLAEERLKHGDISFVVHSFGGFIFEQMLRIASDRAAAEPDVADFIRRISRVVFLGTPHLGADLATWGGRLRLLALPSAAAKSLRRNDPNLRGLNQWYRRYATQNGIATRTLTETRRTWLGLVVKPDSADPGLPSDPTPTPASQSLSRMFYSTTSPPQAARSRNSLAPDRPTGSTTVPMLSLMALLEFLKKPHNSVKTRIIER